MKKLLAPFLFLLLPLPAVASQYDGLYVFGDSLSDTGNEFNAYGIPNSTTHPPLTYFNGRWSNGPLWIEDLAPKLGLTFNNADDYAVAGATTGTLNYESQPGKTPLAGMQTQVATYLTMNPVADPKGLYVLWGGGDDYLGALQTALASRTLPTTQTQAQIFINTLVTTTVDNLTGEIDALAIHGAHNFLIPNLADLGAVPAVAFSGVPGASTLATDITLAHDTGLALALQGLHAQFPTDQFTLLNEFNQFEQISAAPSQYGFVSASVDYYDALLADPTLPYGPNQFLFYDQLHPTAAGHQLIADAAYSALVPEPGIVGLFVGLLAAGTSVGLRRRRRVGCSR